MAEVVRAVEVVVMIVGSILNDGRLTCGYIDIGPTLGQNNAMDPAGWGLELTESV